MVTGYQHSSKYLNFQTKESRGGFKQYEGVWVSKWWQNIHIWMNYIFNQQNPCLLSFLMKQTYKAVPARARWCPHWLVHTTVISVSGDQEFTASMLVHLTALKPEIKGKVSALCSGFCSACKKGNRKIQFWACQAIGCGLHGSDSEGDGDDNLLLKDAKTTLVLLKIINLHLSKRHTNTTFCSLIWLPCALWII